MKKIRETTERYCCQPEDLVELPKHPTSTWRRREPEFMFCKHCGQRFQYYRFMDAAGSMDWGYQPIKGVYVK